MADRKSTMPPPGHGVAIIIAAHPSGTPKGGRMPPPGMSMPDDAMPGDDTDPTKDKDGKASPESAGVIREDAHCGDCSNYDATSGMCSKVAGAFSPDDACKEYFQPVSEDDQEPDADDQGGPPDSDADDAGAMPPTQ